MLLGLLYTLSFLLSARYRLSTKSGLNTVKDVGELFPVTMAKAAEVRHDPYHYVRLFPGFLLSVLASMRLMYFGNSTNLNASRMLFQFELNSFLIFRVVLLGISSGLSTSDGRCRSVQNLSCSIEQTDRSTEW